MILSLFVVIPLGIAFLISLVGRLRKCFADILGNLAVAAVFINSIYHLFNAIISKTDVIVYKLGGWAPPFGIALVSDGLTRFMLVTVNFVAFMITIFSVNYMNKFTSKWKFYTLFLLMLAGMNGVIISGDFFNMFVFLEIASVASFALVAFGVEAEELEASFKYMVMSIVASLFILLGIGFLYSLTSTLNMADAAGVISSLGNINMITLVSVFFFVGFGLKAALVPFHAWLPDAHPAAPAPISATLSGVLIKALGVYAMIRVFYNVLGVTPVLLNTFMVLGTLSIVVGVLLAIGQMDLKRLLAYHSISQVGYIFLGLGLGTPLGVLGAIFHLFNHSVFKSLLFLNSGSAEYATGTRDLEKMGGLRRKMPVTSGTCLTASMSIAGIPPFNGFWSKLIIIFACLEVGHYMYAVWAVIGSILTLASFMKVQKYAFFGKLVDKFKNVKEVPFFMKLSMVVLALVCIVGGTLLLGDVYTYFLQPAKESIIRGLEYKNVVFGALR